MNSAIVTGVNGTLAPVLVEKLKQNGVETTAWDRALVPPDDIDSIRAFLDKVQPDVLCHLAMGNANWAEMLAKETSLRNIKLLFTSTAMVFDHVPNGPHKINDTRTAKDDYGRDKIACEDRILSNNPNALIVRIGWQIAWTHFGNNMFAHLQKSHAENGFIDASEAWYPACSLMTDTCDAIFNLMAARKSGLYQLDSNRLNKLSFADIVRRISDKHSLNWNVRVNQDYVHDQRLLDERIEIPCISNHL